MSLPDLPEYVCHKKVRAAEIVEISWGTGLIRVAIPGEPGYAEITPEHQWWMRNDPRIGGYFVVYEGGFTSYSPPEPFKSGYTLCEA